MKFPPIELVRTTLGVLGLIGMIAVTFTILTPFLPSTIWAMTLVIATWPIMLRLQALLGGRRGLAVATMTLLLLAIVVIPFGAAVVTILRNADQIVKIATAVTTAQIPPAPDWVGNLPMIGNLAAETWNSLASEGATALLSNLTPYVGRITSSFAAAAGSVGGLFVQLLLTIVVSVILYVHGEASARAMLRFGHRLAGDRGMQSVVLAGQAIRGVALGVVVTAVAQSVLGGLGLLVAGVPFAGILTAVMLILCIIQLGPVLVLAPAVGWLFYTANTSWAVVLLIWTIIVVSLDNVLRPFLIKKGANLPLLLILVGVLGGLLAFGLIGLFVGPAVLAVNYTLLKLWLAEDHAQLPVEELPET